MMNNRFDKHDLLQKLIEDKLNKDYEKESITDFVEPSPYAIGTLDKYGMPLQPKMREMYNRVLSKSVSVVVLEGGTRGGKDVFGLHLWGKVLIYSVNEEHLALGVSLEHAINTIMNSNKFGLKHQIPNGRFERLSAEGAGNRGLFTFFNVFGQKRKVHFYGNSKHNDHVKFQGFTIGTTYVNEGINQHINGINEARQRMATSKDGGLMIITQNPVGTTHKLYTEFEAGYMLTNEEIDFIGEIRRNEEIKNAWILFDKKEKLKRKQTLKQFEDAKLKQMNKVKYDDLVDIEKQYIERDKYMLNVDLLYGLEEKQEDGSVVEEIGLYNKPLKDFVEFPQSLIDSKSKLLEASMYKVMTWKRAWKNPNGVENGYNYAYYHLTMKDNLGMNRMSINEEAAKYHKESALYKQRILGERVSSDGIAFPEFSDEDNVLNLPIEMYENNPNTLRVIAIDPGSNHPTGIVDAEVNLDTGEIYVLQSKKVELKDVDLKSRTFSSLDVALFEVIRARKKRKAPDLLIIDPSNPFLIGHYANMGFNTIPADNSRQTADVGDMKYGDKVERKSLKGYHLIKAGFVRKKFWIHEDATDLINEIKGLSIIFNEKTGIEDTVKVGDDVYDAFRYICNTSGIDSFTWERLEVIENYEGEQFLANEEKKNERRNLGRQTPQERANELIKKRHGNKNEVRRQYQDFIRFGQGH